MKAIIDGKLYNTETADLICDCGSRTHNQSDFTYWAGKLYRTKKGAFFIDGHGNAASLYSVPSGSGQNSYMGSSGIKVVDQEWAERICEQELTPEEYDELFNAEEA